MLEQQLLALLVVQVQVGAATAQLVGQLQLLRGARPAQCQLKMVLLLQPLVRRKLGVRCRDLQGHQHQRQQQQQATLQQQGTNKQGRQALGSSRAGGQASLQHRVKERLQMGCKARQQAVLVVWQLVSQLVTVRPMTAWTLTWLAWMQ